MDAAFLFDVKNAEKYNLGEEGITGADLGVVALDDWTLEVTMEGPRAYFPQVVAYYASVPSPQWAIEEYGSERWPSGEVPLWVNGPFKLDRWEHDVVLELSPNPGYWDAESVHVKKVYEPIIPAELAVLAYERGEGNQRLDWVTVSAARRLLDRFREDPELSKQLKNYVYPGIWMLVPSNGMEPFQNDEVGLKVRRALSHAIDRSRLVEVTNGLSAEAFCMVPTGVYGYIDDPEIAAIQAFDPALAMEQLVGTPYEGGQNWPEITMHMRGQEEVYNSNLMANDIVAQLQENLGMNINIQVWPEASWRPELFKNEFQLVGSVGGMTTRTPTMATATCSTVKNLRGSDKPGPTLSSTALLTKVKGWRIRRNGSKSTSRRNVSSRRTWATFPSSTGSIKTPSSRGSKT